MYPYFENPHKHIFISYNRKTYHFPAHFHNNLEIVYCFSGAQSIKLGDRLYTLKKGDAMILFPNTVHEYREYTGTMDEPTEVLSVICNNKLLAESVPDIVTKHAKNPFLPTTKVSENAAFAFERILSADNDIALLGWTFVALSDLLKELALSPLDQNMELPSKVIAYIDTNFKEDLTIHHLAKVFGYHPSYIAHLFCNQLKIPFRTYLGAVRSEYAASQIRTTQKSLTEIAYESGYRSLNTFCRCFKKHFSQTPSQYKKDLLLRR